MTREALVQSQVDPCTQDSASNSSNCLFTWQLPGEVKGESVLPGAAHLLWGPSPGQQGRSRTDRLLGWLQLSGQAEVMKTHLCHRTGTLMMMKTLSLKFTMWEGLPERFSHASSPSILTTTPKCRYYYFFHFNDDKTEWDSVRLCTWLKVMHSKSQGWDLNSQQFNSKASYPLGNQLAPATLHSPWPFPLSLWCCTRTKCKFTFNSNSSQNEDPSVDHLYQSIVLMAGSTHLALRFASRSHARGYSTQAVLLC